MPTLLLTERANNFVFRIPVFCHGRTL